jgi:aspartate/methionine/tyrosine aminotransferase
MKISDNYSSDISEIINKTNNNTLFISTWEKDEVRHNYSINETEQVLKESLNGRSNYYFSDECSYLKKTIVENHYELKESNIDYKNISLLSNGTMAGFLSIYTLFQQIQILKVLLITPMYFSYINILRDFNADIFYVSGLNFDSKAINEIIIREKINLVIVNQPLFGSGVSLNQSTYNNIQSNLKLNNGYLLIDNIYGGISWDLKNEIFSYKTLNSINKMDNFILLESLTKKLQLNGYKHSVLFSNRKLIEKIEHNSVYTAGSLLCPQIEFIKKLYKLEAKNTIINNINTTAKSSNLMYDYLKSLLLSSPLKLFDCSEGFFCLLGIPRYYFPMTDDYSIAKEILNKTNILTIPHDRYLFNDTKYYTFRINLIQPQDKLFLAINFLNEYLNTLN